MNLFHSTQCYKALDTTGVFLAPQNFTPLNTMLVRQAQLAFYKVRVIDILLKKTYNENR